MAIINSMHKSPRIIFFSRNPKEPNDSSGSLQIIPGGNFFNEEQSKDWELCKKHPDVKMMLEEGMLIEVKTTEGKGINKTPDSLEDIEPKMAIELVKATADAKRLNTWLDNEKRASVRSALAEQVKMIEKMDADRKKANERS